MKIIAIEEHFHPKCYIDHLLSRKEPPRLEITEDENRQKIHREWSSASEYLVRAPKMSSELSDIGEGRLKDMDEAGIDMQVLSFPLGLERLDASEAVDVARKVNDELSVAVKKYPDRFAGFAALPLRDPSRAADELERTVKQLGFKGAMIVPHVVGEYVDDKKYWPIYERAAKLGVPLYLHPTFPAPANQHQYASYPQLRGPVWGFAAETGLVAVRLICSGVFDKYPDLQIILGHMGEALPFWMWRMDNQMMATSRIIPRRANGQTTYTPLTQTPKKMPSKYIRENYHVTPSGMSWSPALLCCLLALGAERILFAVDYPYEPNQEAVRFMETAPISDSDKEKIFHFNAEKLLGL